MNKEKLFHHIFEECKSYLRFNNWSFYYKLWQESSLWKIEIDHTHLTAIIKFDNSILVWLDEDIDVVIETILHEMLHIYVWAGTIYMEYQEKIFLQYMWNLSYSQIYNSILSLEEQYVNVLDKITLDWFKKTTEYKEIKKMIKNVK